MDLPTFLALPEWFVLLAVEGTDDGVTLHLQSIQKSALCPMCHHQATRIHSQYQRRVADLPGGARRVLLRLQVQKFYCDNSACERTIFVERLNPFVAPWARMTARLNQALRTIGVATCGRLGARLATHLHMPTSWRTILRRILTNPVPTPPLVPHVGIDDFAFRRGHQYGSLLVDLDDHILLDLLPDRTVETATTWLQAHSEIVLVSRDRGGMYALAAQRALPHAQQVADRFHLVKNLAEAVEPLVARYWTLLPPPETILYRDAPALPPSFPPAPPLTDLSQDCPPPPFLPRRRTVRAPEVQARFVAKQQLFDQIMVLATKQMSAQAIAATLGLSASTVRRWLRVGQHPGSQPRRHYPSVLDRYTGYLRLRWHQGCQEVNVLWQEIQAKGFEGSIRTVYRFVERLNEEYPRPRPIPQERMAEPAPLGFDFLQEYTSRDALWWFIRAPAKLSTRIAHAVEALCEVSPPLRQIYTLIQAFTEMVRTRCGQQLDTWLAEVQRSGLPELQRFAQGLKRDYAAIRAGLTEPYSNGMVEGFVNKIKMIKRLMFGRAGFALLRQRVLQSL